MAEIIRAGLVQQGWTGSKESMIAASVEAIGAAASAGAQVVCLQELFYGPYFCQVQDTEYYSYTEAIPDGPTTKLLQEVAKQHGIVIVAPMYEEEQPGVLYNTAAVIDDDGSYL
ncbi:MAG TPA: nitrilase-related carbon-nitrogen hydrolase, partial [Pseudonocardiaceae bacterium]